jgi:hypothetical protein
MATKQDTFKRLWDQALHKGFHIHPDSLILMEGEDLNLNQARELMSRLQLERDKRVPSAVLDNVSCMACWNKESLSICKSCRAWSLCNRCSEEMEGNCFQCLYDDQLEVARACYKRRPEDPSHHLAKAEATAISEKNKPV